MTVLRTKAVTITKTKAKKKDKYFTRYFKFGSLIVKLYTNSILASDVLERICFVYPTVCKNDILLRIRELKPKNKVFNYGQFNKSGFSRSFYKMLLASGINCYERKIQDIFIRRDTLDERLFSKLVRRLLINQHIKKLLKKELSLIHASAVALNGQAILFIGTKGAGKTTIALNLVKKGFKFICDDRSFFEKENGLINVLGLDMAIKLTKNNLYLLDKTERLDYFAEIPTYQGRQYRFEIERTLPRQWIKKAPVRFLFFLSRRKSKKRLVNVSSSEALDILLGRRLFYSPFKMDKKLDFLIKLVKQTKQYRLYRGSLSELPPLLKKL